MKCEPTKHSLSRPNRRLLTLSGKPGVAWKGWRSGLSTVAPAEILQLWSSSHKQNGLSSNPPAFSAQPDSFSLDLLHSQSRGISKLQRCPRHMANPMLPAQGLALSASDDSMSMKTQLVIPWARQLSAFLQMTQEWIFLFEDYPLLQRLSFCCPDPLVTSASWKGSWKDSSSPCPGAAARLRPGGCAGAGENDPLVETETHF